MAVAYIGMGLPGAGKTTYLLKLAQLIDAHYICADDIRAEIYGSAEIQKDHARVWSIVHQRASAAIDCGKDVVIDGTHIKKADRKATIKSCKAASKIHLIWLKTPYHLCLKRNSARDKVVPEDVITKMKWQLEQQPPLNSEGFNELEIIYSS